MPSKIQLLTFDDSSFDTSFKTKKNELMNRFGIREEYMNHALCMSGDKQLNGDLVKKALDFQHKYSVRIHSRSFAGIMEVRPTRELKEIWDKQKEFSKKRKRNIIKNKEKRKTWLVNAKHELHSGNEYRDVVSIEMKNKIARKNVYEGYLKSMKWKIKRAEAIDFYGGICCHCKKKLTPSQTDVHHVTYERFRNERISDLLTLCRPCHKKEHERLDGLRRKNKIA